jgi:hypothetical protein
VFLPRLVEDVRERSLDHLARISRLLDKRRHTGEVRRGHGDLHLRNICLLAGAPALFDCVEFSEELGSTDVLYDLAFLLMDLAHRGETGLANVVVNRYLDLTDDDRGLPALPLFLSVRAAIRAHVTATAPDPGAGSPETNTVAEGRLYLDEARAALLPRTARLIAVGGLSGTGKSTLAAGLAPELGLQPGARVLRSDVIRKRLLGMEPEEPLPPDGYTPEITRRVYMRMGEKAATALDAGYCVIVDAVALTLEQREMFAAVAERSHVAFSGLWLEASTNTMIERLGARRDDASDASPEVLALQRQCDPGPLAWTRLDAGGDSRACLAAARRALGPT